MKSAALVIACIVLAAVPAFAGGSGAITVFAHVPDPGYPEGLVVEGDLVWTSTPASLTFGAGLGPSTLFGFDRATGALARTIVIPDDLNSNRGLVGMAVDADGRLYVPNIQAGLGIMRVDPTTSSVEVYASIPDLPACLPSSLPAPPIVCSPTLGDKAAFPNDPVFDAAGNLYVSDSFQATIWRIPPGGVAEVWFQSPGLDGIPVGANGLRISPDGARLFIALTFASLGLPAGIYTVDLDDPSSSLAFFAPLDGGDGIAFGASGNLYVTSASTNAVHVLDPYGIEIARYPPDPITNALLPVPMDQPASLAFLDESHSLLVANHAFADGMLFPERWVILEVDVGDTGAPLHKPVVP